jgi:hypothetical protein
MNKDLGVASFMYIIKMLGKRHYMPNDRSVTVTALKSGVQMFSFSKNAYGQTDCGFIHTNMMVLRDIFNDVELNKVLNLCERKSDKMTKILRHCAVADDPNLKKNIPTSTDGNDLNCLCP